MSLPEGIVLIILITILGCVNKGENKKTAPNTGLTEGNTNIIPAGMPIHEASVNGLTGQVLSLLERGVAVDTLDAEGRTPLMYASYNGYTEIIRKLLEKGANVNLQDSYGRTALMMASSGPFKESVKLLLDSSADPNITDTEEHFTALMYAASEGQLEVVRLLLSNNADPSKKDVDGDDALTFARNNGHAEVANFLQSLKK
jgi:ankyrin repeat protein